MADGNGKGINWTVDISTVLAVLGLLGGSILYVTQTRADAQNAKEEAQRLRVEIKDQIDRTQTSLEKGLAGIRVDIAGFPAAAAHLTEIDRRLTDLDHWKDRAEERDREQERGITALRNDVDRLDREINPTTTHAR